MSQYPSLLDAPITPPRPHPSPPSSPPHLPIFLRIHYPTPTTPTTYPILLPPHSNASLLATYLTFFIRTHFPLSPTHSINPDTLRVEWAPPFPGAVAPASTYLAEQTSLSATYALLAVRGGRDVLVAEVGVEGGNGNGGKKARAVEIRDPRTGREVGVGVFGAEGSLGAAAGEGQRRGEGEQKPLWRRGGGQTR